MKKARRAARELALNVLYQWDSAGVPFEEAMETAAEFSDLGGLRGKDADRAEEALAYGRALASGVRDNIKDIDAHVDRLAEGWPVDRQPAVDRNILRIAIYEISHVDSVPPVVAVDEAVELAKRYSTAESGKFVNGVLAGYLREIGEAGQEN
jgi:N utilization substance protein B